LHVKELHNFYSSKDITRKITPKKNEKTIMFGNVANIKDTNNVDKILVVKPRKVCVLKLQ